MKNPKAQSITSLPPSPDQERHARMIKYVTAMSIRMVCFILFFFVQGWWLLVVGLAAVILPYIGVVAANTVVRKPSETASPPAGVIVIRDAK
jgi:predicted cobalt transporter CbtA